MTQREAPRAPGRYFPAVDGLRALAVAAVVAFHAGFPHAGEAAHGVDVFFVISGLLITTILLEEIDERGTIDVPSFYRRRWRRLMPALAVTCAVALVLFAVVQPFNFRGTLLGAITGLTYTSTWFIVFGHDDLGWMAHTWSLSVEEIFYLVWPLILLVAARRTRRVDAVVVGAFVVAVAYHAIATVLGADAAWLFFSPDMRAEQILAGAAIAVVLRRDGLVQLLTNRGARVAHVLGWASAAYLVLALGDAPAVVLGWYRFGSTAIAFASAVVVAHVILFAGSPGARLLSGRLLVWIGRRSYGIYLWHLPLFGLLGFKDESLAVRGPARLFAVVLSVVLADASYRHLERRGPRRIPTPSIEDGDRS